LFYFDGKWVTRFLWLFYNPNVGFVRDNIPDDVTTALRSIIFNHLVDKTHNCEAAPDDFIIYYGLDGSGPIGFYYVAEDCIVFDGIKTNSPDVLVAAAKKAVARFVRAAAKYRIDAVAEIAKIEEQIAVDAKNGEWADVASGRISIDEILTDMKKVREKMFSFAK
jgi:hypothetical protein